MVKVFLRKKMMTMKSIEFKDEDPWFDMVKWLPEEPAKLINP